MGMRPWTHSARRRFRRLGAAVGSVGLVSAAAAGSLLVTAGPAGADPTSVPNQPIVTQVFDGSGSSAAPVALGVSFVVPTSPPGGDPITSETATCVSLTGGASGSATGLGSPIFVGALAATGVYDCTVTATNSLGASLPSAPFFAFLGGQGTCTDLPTAPVRLSTAPGDASATVSWAPATGPCIAGYVVTPYLAGVAQTATIIPGQGTTTVVGNLLNGVTYTFTVSAENGIAVGPASDPTAPITVGASSAVAAVRVTRVAKGTLRIAFNAPANNGAPITSYTARCSSSDHGAPGVKSGKADPLTVSRLTAGKTYTCTVTATNSRGPGPASPKSRPVTV
jgi:large repetitive protein